MSQPQSLSPSRGTSANLVGPDEPMASVRKVPQPWTQNMESPRPIPRTREQVPPVEVEPPTMSEAQPPVVPAPIQEPPYLMSPEMADEPIQVNFEEVDIRTVLKTIGEITGINFIPHKSVTGTVTVMSPTPIRLGGRAWIRRH